MPAPDGTPRHRTDAAQLEAVALLADEVPRVRQAAARARRLLTHG